MTDRGNSLIRLFVVAPLLLGGAAWAVSPAFPGAEGYAAYVTGGRGGSVYHVTNLNDGGAGSFRDAVSNTGGSGPRTVVFDVAGTIVLASDVYVYRADITIAGQTAPGGGITFRDYTVRIRGSNVIMRHLRFRRGDLHPVKQKDDALWIYDPRNAVRNVIIDHCSVSWALDECLSATGDYDNVTIQNCIISEGLNPARHGYGSLFAPTALCHMSVHHNLYAHHWGRAPRPEGDPGSKLHFDMRNNVIYDWGDRASEAAPESGSDVEWNYIGNYAIAGPSTKFSERTYAIEAVTRGSIYKIYIENSKIDSDRNGQVDGVAMGWGNIKSGGDGYTEAHAPFPAAAVTTHDTDTAYKLVVSGAGARPWARDAVDARVIREVTSQTGSIIDSQNEVGGWPEIPFESRPAGWDTDSDGMPDDWEKWFGSDPNAPDNNTAASQGYTYLERYLQWLIDPSSVTDRAGGISCDGVIGLGELSILAGKRDLAGATFVQAYMNGDGTADRGDIEILTATWGTIIPGFPPRLVRAPARSSILFPGSLSIPRRQGN